MTETIGHYRILERLGGGALGDVFRARDTKVGRTVALMVPAPSLVADSRSRAGFVEDARVAAALNHPNIATLFDVVEQDGGCYLAYEFAAGPSLRQEMSGSAVNARRAVELAAQIADALAEGHSRGIVHGDLRPETVVVTPKGSTKILNFGMARWTAGGAARARAASDVDRLAGEDAGVVGYLSPEQAIGSPIDARSDLFSLGTILYEMLSGRNPFAGATPAATAMNVIRATPPLLADTHPDLPPELDAILRRMLAKDLALRHESAVSLAAELRSIGAVLDVRAGDAPADFVLPLDEEPNTGRWWMAGILAAIVLLAWWAWSTL